MAKYIDYGGNFLPRQPGRSDEVVARVFGVQADETKLQQLCDKTLNARGADGHPLHPEVEYRVISPVCLFMFMKMERLSSLHPEDSAKGLLRELELNISIPLLVLRRQAGAMLPVGIVWYMPYLWIDSGVAMSMGRETYGFPKTMARIAFSSEIDDLAPATVEAETWDSFPPAQPCVERRIVEVRREGLGSLKFLDFLPHLTSFLGGFVPQMALAGIAEPFIQQGMLFDQARFVFLKQFRNHGNGDDACYQAIVEAPVQYPVFHGAQWLPGSYTVKVWNYTSVPLVEELGLAAVSATGGGYLLKPKFAVQLSFDFILGNGDTIWVAP